MKFQDISNRNKEKQTNNNLYRLQQKSIFKHSKYAVPRNIKRSFKRTRILHTTPSPVLCLNKEATKRHSVSYIIPKSPAHLMQVLILAIVKPPFIWRTLSIFKHIVGLIGSRMAQGRIVIQSYATDRCPHSSNRNICRLVSKQTVQCLRVVRCRGLSLYCVRLFEKKQIQLILAYTRICG